MITTKEILKIYYVRFIDQYGKCFVTLLQCRNTITKSYEWGRLTEADYKYLVGLVENKLKAIK